MKRTGEMTLGIIGIVLSFFMAIFGVALKWASDSEEIKSVFLEATENDPALNPSDAELVFSTLAGAGTSMLIAAIIGIVIGIIAAIFTKGNKKPKLAGILFIVSAVLITIISFLTGFLPALLYLIAGIMCLVRKPKTVETY
ncbi:DUF4064 domain-containing protein [Bacillus sp. FJAT-50079]|uniref:DUF4064 domain-containing protein n=1 Tax=Bacillus sp. FJAT-50079 TaxID=2833577 RepID=UPI001BC9987F|nr:DUF4064 domain-containing protein [Bacillus sp. FJAT-50079]MBS4207730.1 DUF4064 domain-containing protein [Bacillus sp. FJAT-50079]